MLGSESFSFLDSVFEPTCPNLDLDFALGKSEGVTFVGDAATQNEVIVISDSEDEHVDIPETAVHQVSDFSDTVVVNDSEDEFVDNQVESDHLDETELLAETNDIIAQFMSTEISELH